jgi:hypothetical protein
LDVSEVVANTIKVYPNPFDNLIQLESVAPISEVLLYDILGNVLPIQLKNGTTIDTSNLSSGLYILRLKTASGQQTLKLLKR